MSSPKSKYKIRKQERVAGLPMKARQFQPWWTALAVGPYYSLLQRRGDDRAE